MTDETVLVCCPVCGRVLTRDEFGPDCFPLSDGVRLWSCSGCGSSGYASWPVSCHGVFVVDESPLVGFVGWLGVERPVADCLVPLFPASDCMDEVLLGRSGRVWSVFASSGVPVGFARRDGLRVDVWHVMRPGRVSSCYLDGELDDVAYCRDWLRGGACGAVPAGCFVGR